MLQILDNSLSQSTKEVTLLPRGVLSLIKEKCNIDEKLDEVTTSPPAVFEPQGSVVPATTKGGETKEVIVAEFLCQRKKEM